jgi:hypothetical protein
MIFAVIVKILHLKRVVIVNPKDLEVNTKNAQIVLE